MRLLVAAVVAASLLANAQDVPRPKITGVAHIALYVKDVEKARNFYTGLLGYQEVFDLKNPDGSLSMTFVKVNERQYIELSPERTPDSDRLNHISIEVDDAEAMRKYLASKGVKVPEKVGRGRIGNANFNIKDPAGHTVEIVEYLPDGWSVRDKGKAVPASRVSTGMMHVGIIVNSLEPEMKFYREVLGFEETWRGSRDGKVLSWVNMRVPDGEDYIELMLHDPVPEPTKRGTAHHICLSVPDIEKSLAAIQPRAGATGYTRPLEIRTGVNRKRQMNLYDPDGTRTELMEPHTVDGKPTPPATAPWFK
ncbi:MAG: VOC family protein [Bryobacteraceae bacterium]|nr:VOC family protein [Bryobacteraceae bacterium]